VEAHGVADVEPMRPDIKSSGSASSSNGAQRRRGRAGVDEGDIAVAYDMVDVVVLVYTFCVHQVESWSFFGSLVGACSIKTNVVEC
jgi:hypothetical protein